MNIRKRKRDRQLRRSVTLISTLAFGLWMWTGMFAHVRNVEATIAYPAFEVAAEALPVRTAPGQVIRGQVRGGQSMYTLLGRHGLQKAEVMDLVKAARDVRDLSRLGKGQVYRVRLDDAGQFRTFEVDLSDSQMLTVSATPFGFYAETQDIAYETRLRHLSGRADGGDLFASLMREKGGGDLIRQTHEMFAWEVNFKRDVQPGDRFEMLVDEIRRDGEFERFGAIRWVQLVASGESHEALNFEGEFYNNEGVGLRRTLLPSPVGPVRVTSRFSEARMHPVLGRVRPHHGVDFAARWGAPVGAAGDGVVNFAGWKGDNGYMVSVRHNGVYRTVYSHLSRIPATIKRGARVKQGQTIGFVGNSGVSTGTHLHYGVYKHGRAVDPLTLDYTPVLDPIDLTTNPQFVVAWDDVRLVLLGLRREPGQPGRPGQVVALAPDREPGETPAVPFRQPDAVVPAQAPAQVPAATETAPHGGQAVQAGRSEPGRGSVVLTRM